MDAIVAVVDDRTASVKTFKDAEPMLCAAHALSLSDGVGGGLEVVTSKAT